MQKQMRVHFPSFFFSIFAIFFVFYFLIFFFLIDYISMSWGAQEGSYISSYEPYFANSLKSFFASTGDNGTMGGISYPASSANVVAVGMFPLSSFFFPPYYSASFVLFLRSSFFQFPLSLFFLFFLSCKLTCQISGGTSLYTNTDYTLAAEQGWGGSGGGCSAFTTAVPAQTTTAGYSHFSCFLLLLLFL